mgnify:CR=1 FL=1
MAVFINRQAPQSGIASLLALQGRGGDTELVHMTRPEVKRLQQSGLMSVNPDTGLPEYFLGDVFDTVKASVKNIFKPENIIPAVASIALPAIAGPLLPAGLGLGLSPLATRSILSGAGTALGSLPFRSLSDSLSAGVVSGGLQYGTGRLRQALGPSDADLGIGSAKENRELQRQMLRNDLKSYADSEGMILAEGPPMYLESGISELGDPIMEEYVLPKANITEVLADPNLTSKQLLGMIPTPANQEPLTMLSPEQIARNFPKRFEELQKTGIINKDDLGPFERTVGTVSPAQQAAVISKYGLSGKGNFSVVPEKTFTGTGREAYNDRFSAARQAFGEGDFQAGFEAIPEGYMTLDGGVDTGAIFGDIGRGLASVEATSLVDAVEAQRMAEEEAAQKLIARGVPPKIARKRVTLRRGTGEFGSTGAGLTAAEARRRAIEGGGFEFFGPSQFVSSAQGGLINLAAGGKPDFEGMVGGDGHGMEDNQIMEIKGGGLLAVSPKEYVVPADVMAMIGNGNPDDGADEMDEFISEFRKEKYGRDMQPPEMDGGKALQSLMS